MYNSLRTRNLEPVPPSTWLLKVTQVDHAIHFFSVAGPGAAVDVRTINTLDTIHTLPYDENS